VSETTETDPVAGFAALMSGAAQEAAPGNGADLEAPYGYTEDPRTGERRPKKSPGRPRKSPSLEDLKAAKEAEPAPDDRRDGDRAPQLPKGRRGRRAEGATPRPAAAVPQKYRAEGSIAKGINQLYRRTGRLVRVFDQDIGQALIDITRAEDPEDVTVGDAWEQLAQSNPRVKAFLLRMLAGGAWSGVFMAHAPVMGAILMKDAIRRRIPLASLFTAVAEDETEASAGERATPMPGPYPPDVPESPDDVVETPFGPMRRADVEQMMTLAQMSFGRAAEHAGAGPVRGDGQPGV
jgi:hypothetical protein